MLFIWWWCIFCKCAFHSPVYAVWLFHIFPMAWLPTWLMAMRTAMQSSHAHEVWPLLFFFCFGLLYLLLVMMTGDCFICFLSWWLWCQARLLHLLIVRMAVVQGSVFTNLKWTIFAFTSLVVVWCVAPGICSTEVKLFTIPIAVQDMAKQLNSFFVAICRVVGMNNNKINKHSYCFVRRCSLKLANRDTSRPRISIFSSGHSSCRFESWLTPRDWHTL